MTRYSNTIIYNQLEPTIATLISATTPTTKAKTPSHQRREVIGSLVYIASCSRPDISYAVNKLAQYCEKPRLAHWHAVKHIIRYLSSTQDYGIEYTFNDKRTDSLKLTGYSDADFASDIDTRRSVSGYIVMIAGGAVAWRSKKQSTIASSSTEAELIAASDASRELMWLPKLILGCRLNLELPTKLYIDNQSTLKVITNEKANTRLKHVAVKHMFVKEQVTNNNIDVDYITSDDQIADPLTKSIHKPRFERLRKAMGIAKLCMSLLMMLNVVISVEASTGHTIILHYVNPCDDIKNIKHEHYITCC